MAAFTFSDPRLLSGTIQVAYGITSTIAKGTLTDRKGVPSDPSDEDLTVAGIAITDGDSGDALVIAKNGSRLRVTEDIIPGRTYVSVAPGQYDLEENLSVGDTYRATLIAEDNSTVRLKIFNSDIVKVADA